MARHGDEAVWIVSRPKALAIFVRHGDDAATALLRHRTIAESLLDRFQTPAIRVLNQVSARNGRRLAMLAEEGVLTRTARSPELLGVIGRHGDRALEFIWRHRPVLAGSAALAVFLAHPEPFLDGTAQILEAVGTTVTRPLAETGRAFASSWGCFTFAMLGSVGIVLLISRLLPAATPGAEMPEGASFLSLKSV